MNEEQCNALGQAIVAQCQPIRHKAMADNPGCVVEIIVHVKPAPVKPFRQQVVTRPLATKPATK